MSEHAIEAIRKLRKVKLEGQREAAASTTRQNIRGYWKICCENRNNDSSGNAWYKRGNRSGKVKESDDLCKFQIVFYVNVNFQIFVRFSCVLHVLIQQIHTRCDHNRSQRASIGVHIMCAPACIRRKCSMSAAFSVDTLSIKRGLSGRTGRAMGARGRLSP